MKIRPATLADAAALAAIEQLQPYAAGWGVAGFTTELVLPAAVIWCALEQDQLIGFVALRQAAGQSEILNIAMHPNYTQRGIGSQLLERALIDLQTRGVEQVSLEAACDNEPAGALYRKAGFAVQGRRKDFYGAGKDAYIWERKLYS